MEWFLLLAAALGAAVRLLVRQQARERARREQESRGAKALYEEMEAALRSVNMAARNTQARWVNGVSESPTLAETWVAHGRAFEGLDLARWEILDDAVKAVEPVYGLGLVGVRSEPMQPSLEERQQKLRRGMEVLRDMLPPEGAPVAAGAPPSRRRRRPSGPRRRPPGIRRRPS